MIPHAMEKIPPFCTRFQMDANKLVANFKGKAPGGGGWMETAKYWGIRVAVLLGVYMGSLALFQVGSGCPGSSF